jgi:uncharacterized protein YbaA (DUF1428 family)
MMTYIDGFVASVAHAQRDGHRAYVQEVAALFIEHGALRVVDTWGDDVPHGKITDFQRAVAATEGETVVFGWIEWPDKATRMAGFAAIENEPRMAAPPPFDGKRMIFGGFEALNIAEG